METQLAQTARELEEALRALDALRAEMEGLNSALRSEEATQAEVKHLRGMLAAAGEQIRVVEARSLELSTDP